MFIGGKYPTTVIYRQLQHEPSGNSGNCSAIKMISLQLSIYASLTLCWRHKKKPPQEEIGWGKIKPKNEKKKKKKNLKREFF